MELEKLTLKDVFDAHTVIREKLPVTPLEKSLYLSNEKSNVFLKLECMQPVVRAFKIRGAINKMSHLTKDEIAKGIAAVSSGNHGISVSYAANLMGIKNAVVIVPKNTPQPKIDKIKSWGAQVRLVGNNYDEAHTQGLKMIKEEGLTEIDSYYSDKYIYAGQGTMLIEMLAQNPDIDTVLAPIGGGGMLGGIAVAAKGINPNIKVYGVQTAACPAMVDSVRDNICYEERDCVEPSICEALVGGIGIRSFEICKDKSLVDDILVVSEESIKKAVAHLAIKEKIVAEPAGAVTTAAYLAYPEKMGKNVALVVSGANIDNELFTEIIEKYK